MASFQIRKRLKRDGTARYAAQVRVKEGGRIILSENRKKWGQSKGTE